jgi:hypothetical protein
MVARCLLLAIVTAAVSAGPLSGQAVTNSDILDNALRNVVPYPPVNPEIPAPPIVLTPIVPTPIVTSPVVPNLNVTPNGPFSPGAIDENQNPYVIVVVEDFSFSR